MSSNNPVFITQSRGGLADAEATTGVSYQIKTIVHSNPEYTGDQLDKTYLLNLFVYNIVDPADPSQDTFDHYATIADLDLLPTARDQAITQGLSQYRDNVNFLKFDNLSVATTAAQVVRDTLNNLVSTYLRVKADFTGASTHYFPYNVEIETLRTEYIDAYTTARDARVVSEQEQDTSQQAYNAAQKENEVVLDAKTKICELYDFTSKVQTLSSLVPAKYKETLKALITEFKADTEYNTSYDAAMTALENYIDDASNYVFDSSWANAMTATNAGTGLSLIALIIQLNALAQSYCATYTTKLNTSDLNKSSALEDLNEKQASKEAASTIEQSALATLSTYCPNLDPSSL
tara:strand:- start:41111 stop:42154 length:1044 start_codon:yes stop_codon:yes gene_type:complete